VRRKEFYKKNSGGGEPPGRWIRLVLGMASAQSVTSVAPVGFRSPNLPVGT
jgi:hypothetical protein